MTIAAPVLLDASHWLDGFDCGEPTLDDWLQRRAAGNAESGASRCYIACDGAKVIGYYALAAGAVAQSAATGKFRRNMPEPIPVIVLGRLAVDRSAQANGIGRALFRDAGMRVLQAASIVGVRGLLVSAISDKAKAFYVALGMVESPLNERVLMMTMKELQVSLGA